jgi:uncharacterized protein YqeY
MIRDDIKAALTNAMKARDTARVAALRMIQAAVKNRDIELRTSSAGASDDAIIVEVLTKMAKQRRESIEMFEKGGRTELAAAERAELGVIEEFLPQPMSEEEAKAAIEALKVEVGASSPKDIGRVMAELKARYAGRIDMGRASGMVKAALG